MTTKKRKHNNDTDYDNDNNNSKVLMLFVVMKKHASVGKCSALTYLAKTIETSAVSA